MKFNTTLKGRITAKVVDCLLQEGEYAASKHKKTAAYCRMKGCKMDPKKRDGALEKLEINKGDVWVDLFASVHDNQEEMFMTEMNSAWNYDWRKFCLEGKYMWANPPFDD